MGEPSHRERMREPRGRPAAPVRPEHGCALERRREGRGHPRVTWEIEPVGDSFRLVVTHDELREGPNAELYGGRRMILCGLKTWLETGEVLPTPGSLLYG